MADCLYVGAVYLAGLFLGGHDHRKAAHANPDGLYCVCESTLSRPVVKKSRPALNCALSRVRSQRVTGEQFTDGLFPPRE